MTPNDKLKAAGYIAGKIGYDTYGYGDTGAAALTDLREHMHRFDNTIPAHPASKEAMVLAAADKLSVWYIVGGTIYSKMAGCNWVIESMTSGALTRDQIIGLACQFFTSSDAVIFADGTIGLNAADKGQYYATAEFAVWAAEKAA